MFDFFLFFNNNNNNNNNNSSSSNGGDDDDDDNLTLVHADAAVNKGTQKMRERKMRGWKMWHQYARMENARKGKVWSTASFSRETSVSKVAIGPPDDTMSMSVSMKYLYSAL